jgi:AcrR family transcriptional regulator
MLPPMANPDRAVVPLHDASAEPSPEQTKRAPAPLGIEQLATDAVVEVIPRRPTPEERAAQRREEIIDSAARVFATKGYHAAGISDIAADLGIAHGTLYRYFNSKQEIAERLLDRVLQLLAQTLLQEDPTASETLAGFREQMVRIINGVFDLYERNPDHMRFFQHQSMTIDADRIGDALDSFTEFIERFVTNGVQKGFFRDDLDVEVMSQSFVGVMFDILRRMLRSPDAAALRDRWVAHGPTAMLDGIAAR